MSKLLLYVAKDISLKLAFKKIFPLRTDVIRIQFGGVQRFGLAQNWYLKFVQPGTAANFIIKSSLLFLLPNL